MLYLQSLNCYLNLLLELTEIELTPTLVEVASNYWSVIISSP